MVLKRMEDEGLVFSFYIDCGIEVWRLKPAQKKSLP